MGPKLDDAIRYTKQAIEHEQKKEYAEAIKSWANAAECYVFASKYEVPEGPSRDKVREKAAEAVNRAEHLREITKKQLERPQKATTSNGQDEHEDEKNGEDDKFMKQLDSTIVSKPNVKWSDVAGLEQAKEALKEAVIFPIIFSKHFNAKRKAWKGILLFGPPGTGKSYLAKAAASEAANSTFFAVSSSDLVSKWMGESEKLIRSLFALARKKAPSIIFMDEVDSLCSARSDSDSESGTRIKNQFLIQMQSVGPDENNVVVFGATNRPWAIDSAILRRFNRRIFIPLPDKHARYQIFKLHVGDTSNSLTEEDFQSLAEKTEKYSGSDISDLVQDGLMEPMRKVYSATHFKKIKAKDDKGNEVEMLTPCSPGDAAAIEMPWEKVPADELLPPPVSAIDMAKALAKSKPSLKKGDLDRLQAFMDEFGLEE